MRAGFLQFLQGLPGILEAGRVHEFEEIAHTEALAMGGGRKRADAHGIVLGERGHDGGLSVIHITENGDDGQFAGTHGA
jgi:hypothetical protein